MTVYGSGAAARTETFARGFHVLAVNGGSSSIRFAWFEARNGLVRLCHGKFERAGNGSASLSVQSREESGMRVEQLAPAQAGNLAQAFGDWIRSQSWFGSLDAVAHRFVHGMQHREPQAITPELLSDLRRLAPIDPEHLPLELELVEAVRRSRPELPQFACFDTAFHQHMPRTAKLLPIPRRYFFQGVQRYGFHGLSYAFLSDELRRIGEPATSSGRMVYAHLGSGASVVALRDGVSVDTSMAFTANAGMPMSSRSGDLDPGIGAYLARIEQMDGGRFQRLVNEESGLLGISELSADMRDLLALEGSDERAADAVEIFCSSVRKWIAAMAAALGGLDVLVFTGGIGESSPVIRERIGDGLGFLGIGIDHGRNQSNAAIISPDPADVRVRVVNTDEELVLAGEVARILARGENIGATVDVERE